MDEYMYRRRKIRAEMQLDAAIRQMCQTTGVEFPNDPPAWGLLTPADKQLWQREQWAKALERLIPRVLEIAHEADKEKKQ